MTKTVTAEDRRWHPIEVRGITMQACRLWEGDHNVESGLYRMPAGMTIPRHHHAHWCQVFVVSGAMAVRADGEEPHTIGAGGFYFVEPGDTHVEAALEDTLLLVICEEERPEFRCKP
jgi:quercetin dioxygenase-like cupin family protein